MKATSPYWNKRKKISSTSSRFPILIYEKTLVGNMIKRCRKTWQFHLFPFNRVHLNQRNYNSVFL